MRRNFTVYRKLGNKTVVQRVLIIFFDAYKTALLGWRSEGVFGQFFKESLSYLRFLMPLVRKNIGIKILSTGNEK